MTVKVRAPLAHFHSELWALTPERHFMLAQALQGVTVDGALAQTLAESRAAAVEPRVTAGDTIAVISLHGTIYNRAGWLAEFLGLIDPHGFANAVRYAAADPSVAAILLSIDSPGGTVAGTNVAAAAVREAAQQKRVIAVADGMMASGAYWIGSQATEVVVDPLAEVGSVGVIATHYDLSGKAEKDGVKVSYFRSSPHKALGQPYEPLSEAAGEEIQQRVMAAHREFVSSITAARRGVSSDALSGRLFTGGAAVDVGLADRVASFYDVLAELASGQRQPGAAMAAKSAAGRKRSMKDKEKAALDETAPEAVEGASTDLQALQALQAQVTDLTAKVREYERRDLAESLLAKVEGLSAEDMANLRRRAHAQAQKAEDEQEAREAIRGLIALAMERHEALQSADRAEAKVRDAKREALALGKLAEAKLPATTEDLDAKFRSRLVAVAQAASTDSAAERAIEELLEERRGLLASQGLKTKKEPAVADLGAKSQSKDEDGLREYRRAQNALGLN